MKKKKHLLFVCTAGIRRSPTAAALFAGSRSYEARAAGTHVLSPRRIRRKDIEWADRIFVMDEAHDGHAAYVKEHFDVSNTPVVVLDIPDHYGRDDLKLITMLEKKLAPYLAENGS